MQEKSGAARRSRLVKFANAISPDCGPWLEAMMAESDHIENRLEGTLWKAGMFVVLFRLALRRALTEDGCRPIELTATAIYLFGLSGYVLEHLLSELVKGTREPWFEAWLPIVLCFWVAIVPSLIAIGVWVCDDFARRLVVLFTALELVNVVAYTHSFGVTEIRVVKFCCTLFVLAAMFTPRVKHACGWRPPDPNQKLLKLS